MNPLLTTAALLLVIVASGAALMLLWRRLRRTQRELQASRRRAELAAQRAEQVEGEGDHRDRFFVNMSHELRTPINGIIGVAGLLSDTVLDAEQREYVQTMRLSAEALLTIINDILDLAKAEAGQVQLEALDFSLRHTLHEAVELQAIRAEMRGLALYCHVHPEVPDALRGDPGRLRQIVLNLISNALKFTDDGEIGVEVSLVERDRGGVAVKVAIWDTGVGIDPQDAARLFEPFTQADSSTTRRHGGTGLGLAISRQLVSLFGGDLQVDSALGHGSTFWFVTRFEEQRDPPRELDLERLLQGTRVLIADGLATERRILEQNMAAWGMRPLLAGDSEEAMAHVERALLEDDPIEAALISYDLPGTDGAALTERLKGELGPRAPAVVLLTSYTGREHARGMRAMRLTAHLSRPVRIATLRQRLLELRRRQVHEVDVEPMANSPTLREPPSRWNLSEITEIGMEPSVTQPVLIEAGEEGLEASLDRLMRGAAEVEGVVPPRRKRILVVEDNRVNQLVTARQLQKLGYGVDVVADGLEALEAVGRTVYAAVLMDCQMPLMDGFEATRRIRRQPGRLARLPIIAMTASDGVEERQRCLEVGMDDLLAKPVKPDTLESKLALWAGEPL